MSLDITALRCPMTYVRTRLALEPLAAGDVLEVRVKGEEPLKNIPRSAAEEGHAVAAPIPQDDGTHVLVIEKDGARLQKAARIEGR